MAHDLFSAIATGDLHRLSVLLEAGADPNARKPVPPQWLALHEAIEALESNPSTDSILLLLRHGAHVDGDGGDTPLLMALYRARPEVARIFLAAGADVNVRGPEGDSPLRWAVQRSDCAMAATLLRCGGVRTIDEAGGPLGATALGIAAIRLDVEMIALLLRFGANANALDIDRMTAQERLPPADASNADLRSLAAHLLSRAG
ncbi:MAG: ankyrin repeat domain-containing protein [Polyangiaceae bacterium]|nr:ankyrin repeat domain-containing protein [Polyangiaceae bacterium]